MGLQRLTTVEQTESVLRAIPALLCNAPYPREPAQGGTRYAIIPPLHGRRKSRDRHPDPREVAVSDHNRQDNHISVRRRCAARRAHAPAYHHPMREHAPRVVAVECEDPPRLGNHCLAHPAPPQSQAHPQCSRPTAATQAKRKQLASAPPTGLYSVALSCAPTATNLRTNCHESVTPRSPQRYSNR